MKPFEKPPWSLDMSIKRNRCMRQNRSVPDVQEKRKNWGEQHLENAAEHLVFLDESGVNTDMTRHYARSKKNERAVDSTPVNTPCNTTVLSSVRLNGKTCHTVYNGGNDSGEICRISENNVNSHIVQNRYHSDGQYALPPCQNRETGIGGIRDKLSVSAAIQSGLKSDWKNVVKTKSIFKEGKSPDCIRTSTSNRKGIFYCSGFRLLRVVSFV